MHQDFVGKNILTLQSLDSTNDYCKQLSENKNVNDGTVVRAISQKRGRGYSNNSWESEGGKNLTFSIILYPDFLDAADQFCISMIVSLGVTDFLKEHISGVFIKWPNDIYVGSSKIAGILIENFIMETNITSSIAGIGLNINQESFGNHLPNPVSLRQITSEKYNLVECLGTVCRKIDWWYNQLKQGETGKIKDHYTNQLLRLNSKHPYKSGNKVFSGYIRGVDNFGRLAMEMENGETTWFGLKQVEFIDLK